jgi:cysteine-rich repeat protein
MPDSTGATPACGDGEIQGDEVCDDGNDVAGDGCTECRASLTPYWVRTFGSAFEDDAALSVAARAGVTAVGGALAGDGGDGDVWIEVLDDEGNSAGRLLTGGTSNLPDMAFGVQVDDDGTIWATGVSNDTGAYADAFTHRITPTFEIAWTASRGTDATYDTGTGIVLAGGGGVFVGASLSVFGTNDAWIGRYDAEGNLVEEYFCDCGDVGILAGLAPSARGIRALAGQGLQRLLWGFDGPLADGPWSVPLAVDQYDVALDAMPNGETIVCGANAGGNDISLWVARFDVDGDEIWAVQHDLGDGDQTCRGVAVDGSDVFVAGSIREDDQSARGFVTRLDPAVGDLVRVEELVVDQSMDTRVLAVDVDDGVPVVVGAFAVDALDDDAFVARLVP